MKFYNKDGKEISSKSEDRFYYKKDKLIAVPTIFSSKEDLIDYIVECLKEKYDDVSQSEVEKIYNEKLQINQLILKYLIELRNEVQSKGEIYKVKAYSQAIKAVERLQFPLLDGKHAQKYIKGIGKKIADKIDEIVETGQLRAVERRGRESIDRQNVIQLFMDIWGVGIKLATHFYEKGYRSLGDINIDADLNDAQKIGLKYYDDFKTSIPREEVKEIGERLEEQLKEINPMADICICGSYRRGAKQTGDVDILLRIKGQDTFQEGFFEHLIERLITYGDVLVDKLSLGKSKYLGLGKVGLIMRRIDIRLVPDNEWFTSQLYFTGSKTLNIQMREQAIKLGYKLSEKGLFKGNKRIPINSEEDVFEKLGMKYLEPSQR